MEELARRPRRRLLGTGGNPIPLALLGVLLIACGFIGGVLVEKGQSLDELGRERGDRPRLALRRIARRRLAAARVAPHAGGSAGWAASTGGAGGSRPLREFRRSRPIFNGGPARPPGRSPTCPGARCM